jgi:hypothetical protein
MDPPPAKGVHDERARAGQAAQCLVRRLHQRAAGLQVGLVRGVVPVGEVGDEVEQRPAQLRVVVQPFRVLLHGYEP